MPLTKSQRAALREMFGGLCAYCGHPLGDRWHADHIEPIFRKGTYVRVDEPGRSHKFVQNGECHNPENERADNYFPACVPCNIHKSSSFIEDWRKQLEDQINVAMRGSSPLRHAKRFGMFEILKTKIVFHFELKQATHD